MSRRHERQRRERRRREGGRDGRERKEGEEIGGKVLREFSLCDVTRSISIKDREGGVNELIYRLPF